MWEPVSGIDYESWLLESELVWKNAVSKAELGSGFEYPELNDSFSCRYKVKDDFILVQTFYYIFSDVLLR